ncbi:MAG: beta-lactamase family protein [Chloroflexi bacterium]|nr:beta-lactamase family protein [Chloroflexota bacterium]
MKTFLIAFFVFALILAVTVLAVQPPKPPKSVSNLAELETHLTELTNSNIPPGLSAIVVKGDEVVYANSFGMANGLEQIPASMDTTYHWWSMTKVPTAIAIMQLQEQGLLNIDDPVEKYLPFFQVEYKGESVQRITIRQLLSHTSGVRDVVPAIIGWVHYEDEIYNQTDLVKKYLPEYNELLFAPGSDSAYTNLGYMILGAVIEAISGQSYEEYITENILIPAGMNNTGFLYTDKMTQNEAAGSHPIVHMFTPLLPFLLDMNALVREQQGKNLWLERVYLDVTPSSGLIGSISDIGELLKSLMTSETLLSENSKTAMMPTGKLLAERPLGWAEYQLGEQPYVQHMGGGPGFATIMRLYPHEGLGIAILANSTSLDAASLIDLFASLDW